MNVILQVNNGISKRETKIKFFFKNWIDSNYSVYITNHEVYVIIVVECYCLFFYFLYTLVCGDSTSTHFHPIQFPLNNANKWFHSIHLFVHSPSTHIMVWYLIRITLYTIHATHFPYLEDADSIIIPSKCKLYVYQYML